MSDLTSGVRLSLDDLKNPDLIVMDDAMFPAISLGGPVLNTDPLEALGITGKTRIDEDERIRRIKRSFGFGLKSAMELKDLWKGEVLCIVGGGPSLEHTFHEIVDLVAAGAKVAAVNKSHDWLIERGLIPTFGVLCDPKEFVAGYMTPTDGVKYLIGSQCHDDTFKAFEGVDEVYLWHAMGDNSDFEFMLAAAKEAGQGAFGTCGGSTTGLRMFDIAPLLLGFTGLHWFAMDSSATDGKTHPYDKPKIDPLLNHPVALTDPVDGRELATGYWTTEPLWHQFRQFLLLMEERREGIKAGRFPKVSMAFHGFGLLPDWCALRGMHADPNRAAMLRAAQPETPTTEEAAQ